MRVVVFAPFTDGRPRTLLAALIGSSLSGAVFSYFAVATTGESLLFDLVYAFELWSLFGSVVLLAAFPTALGRDCSYSLAVAVGLPIGFVLVTTWPFAFSTPTLPELLSMAVVAGLVFGGPLGLGAVVLGLAWRWLELRVRGTSDGVVE